MVALAGNQPANRENKLLPKSSSSVSTLLAKKDFQVKNIFKEKDLENNLKDFFEIGRQYFEEKVD